MTYFDDAFDRDSGFSLDDALDWAETDYRELFDDYWGVESKEPPEQLERDDWLAYRKLFGLAAEIASAGAILLKRKGLGAHRLALPKLLEREARVVQENVDDFLAKVETRLSFGDWWKLHEALLPVSPGDPRTRRNFFRNSLQLQAARLFPSGLREVTERLQKLVGYLVRYPNERAAAYLGRVAECYIRGMTAELAVMARSVLDSTLQELVHDDHVKATVGAGDYITLERRIACCEADGILSGDALAAANRIRASGRDAAHVAPGLEPDADTILEDLVRSVEPLLAN